MSFVNGPDVLLAKTGLSLRPNKPPNEYCPNSETLDRKTVLSIKMTLMNTGYVVLSEPPKIYAKLDMTWASFK